MQTRICPYCKSEVLAGASHCAHCGKAVSKLDMLSGQMFKLGCAVFLVAGALSLAMFFCAGGG